MEAFFEAVLYLFSEALLMYSVSIIMGKLLGKIKYERSSVIWVYCFSFLCLTFIHLYWGIPLLNLASNLVLYFAISCMYQSSFSTKWITIFMIYGIFFVADCLVTIAVSYSHHKITTENDISLYATVAVGILVFLMVTIVANLIPIQKNEKLPMIYWCSVTFITLGTMFVIFLLVEAESLGRPTKLFGMAVMLVIFFLTFYLYQSLVADMVKKRETELLNKQVEYYEKQFFLMENSQETSRILYHDMKNHVIAIQALARKSENQSILDYSEKLVKNLQVEQVVRTGNTVVDSIINFKGAYAEMHDIRIEADVKINSDIKIKSHVLVTILGNLLDNAIDATEALDKEFKWIKLSMTAEKSKITLNIQNPFHHQLIFNKKGLLDSTKQDVKNHGLGLESIRKLLDEETGIMEILPHDKIFEIQVIFYEKHELLH